MKIALAQIESVLCDIDANIKKHLEFIDQAIKENADMIIFPELSLTGYDVQKKAPDIAMYCDDPRLKPLVNKSCDIKIMCGLIEVAFAGQIYNSLVYYEGGALKAIHHKIVLPNYGALEEAKHFSEGRYLDLFDLERNWQAAPLICNDFWNPGLINLASIKGATMFIVPINSALGAVDYCSKSGWHTVARYNAMIFGTPTIIVNRVGQENKYKFWGGTHVYNAEGNLIAEAKENEEDLIFTTLCFQDVVKARAKLPTVRDSNLDLILREMKRIENEIGLSPHLKTPC